jgi:hypothetical protein
MTSQEAALEEVRERLIKLERQNRRLKQTGAARVALAARQSHCGRTAPRANCVVT